jgi:ssDNA-binding Zn-finger/Zn-ribbon topoisomerase 1
MYSTRLTSETPPLALTGICPLCDSALVMRKARRDQSTYIGCTNYPHCTYSSEYDEALQQLRDQLARAEAEAALLRLQTRPVAPHKLIQRSLVESGLQRLGNLVLQKRHVDPALAAEVTNAIMLLCQRVRGEQV